LYARLMAVTGKRAGSPAQSPYSLELVLPGPYMLTTILLEKLLEIERQVGHADNLAIRNMLMDAEADVMQAHQELVELLEQVRRLREQQAGCARKEGCVREPAARQAEKRRPARFARAFRRQLA